MLTHQIERPQLCAQLTATDRHCRVCITLTMAAVSFSSAFIAAIALGEWP